jgi:hypothetical protein
MAGRLLADNVAGKIPGASAQSVHRELLPVEKRSCTIALEAISPTLSALYRTWPWEKGKLRVRPEVPDQ